jgi:teichoic acid transport system permease protein
VSNTTSADAGPGAPLPRPDMPDDPPSVWPDLQQVNARIPLRRYFRDMWARRHFALAVPAGELKAQHQDTFLGQVWHLFNPLLLTFVYWLVFGTIFQRAAREGVPYIAFLVAGIIPFQFTQKCIMSGARLIHGNRKLIQSVHFPRAVLPVSAVIGELLAHGSAMIIMFVVIGVTQALVQDAPTMISAWWLLAVPITLLQVVFNLGLALFASRLTFHFRDIQNIIPYVMRIAFYLSGVIFSIETFTQGMPTLRAVLEFNPISGFIRLMRDAALNGTTSAGDWWLVLGWTMVLVVGGFLFFRAAETEYGRV